MSKGPSNVTSTTKTTLPKWVDAQAQANLKLANTVADRPYEAYTGDTVAGMDPLQLQAIKSAQDSAGIYTGATKQGLGMLADVPGAAQKFMDPYLADVEKGALTAFGHQAASEQNQLEAKIAGAGSAFGGSRFGIQQAVQAASEAEKAGQISATIRSQGWDKAVSDAIAAGNSLITGAQTGQATQTAQDQALFGAGSALQAQDQAGLTDAYKRWAEKRDYPLQQLAIRQSGLSATPYGSTTTNTQPVSSNPIASGLGTAIGVGQLLGTTGAFGAAGWMAPLLAGL